MNFESCDCCRVLRVLCCPRNWTNCSLTAWSEGLRWSTWWKKASAAAPLPPDPLEWNPDADGSNGRICIAAWKDLRLAEIVDESNDGVLLQRIFDTINVHVDFVEKRMEEVGGFDGRWTLLFIAEDEIDPLVQVLRDVVALQCGTMKPDEFPGIILSPGRKYNIVQGHSALFASEIETVGVDQKVVQVEKFRNQLLDVGHVQLGCRPPGLSDGMK